MNPTKKCWCYKLTEQFRTGRPPHVGLGTQTTDKLGFNHASFIALEFGVGISS